MGSWRNRPRFYRRRSPPRSWCYYPCSSSSGYGEDDGIPTWEKKFCELIGSVPWQKVVEATHFKSWYQGSVTTWNDSACQDAFHNAKKRFWAEINGLPCDISLPDPEMFIEEINWDSVIAPELIIDLERAYSAAPDEENTESKLRRRGKDINSKTPFKQHNEVLFENPLETNDRFQGLDTAGKKSEGWNLSENCSVSELKDSNKGLNPWEGKSSCRNEREKDGSWGATSGNGWETERWGNSRCKTKDRGNNSWKEEPWDNDGWNKPEHQNKKTRTGISVPSQVCNNPWETKRSCGVEASKDATWGACSGKVYWGNDKWKNKDWENNGCGNKGWYNYGQNPRGPKGHNSKEPNRVYNPWKDGGETHRTGGKRESNWEVKRSNKQVGRSRCPFIEKR